MAWGIMLGGAAAVGLVSLASRVFAACDVGLNAGATSMALTIVLPILWGLNVAVFVAAFAVVRATTRRRSAAVGAGLVALVLVAWLLIAWQVTPADYPDPICPANVPPWWPSWIPV